MHSANIIESFRLDKILQVAKPRYLLGTTYTLSLAFFESAVFPNIGRDTLRKAVILSDQFGFNRAIDEAPALGGAGQDYVVESISTDRCLHAKVWFVIGDSDFVLLVGSGNLTQSGFITNAELFETLRFSESDRMPQQTYTSIKSFLNGLAASVADPAGIAAQAISEIATELERFASDKDLTSTDPVFIHSFDQPIVDQLPAGGVGGKLEIAAPFFGAGLAGIRLLANRFSHDHIKVFPAVHNGSEIDLPTGELQKAFPKSTAARLHDQFKPGAFQHLKLYGAKAVDQS